MWGEAMSEMVEWHKQRWSVGPPGPRRRIVLTYSTTGMWMSDVRESMQRSLERQYPASRPIVLLDDQFECWEVGTP